MMARDGLQAGMLFILLVWIPREDYESAPRKRFIEPRPHAACISASLHPIVSVLLTAIIVTTVAFTNAPTYGLPVAR